MLMMMAAYACVYVYVMPEKLRVPNIQISHAVHAAARLLLISR